MKIQSHFRLIEAIKFYQNHNIEYIDVPWDVSPEISALTKPANCKDFYLEKDTVLVASAEQSFLQVYDQLHDTKIYMALTPCFRDEPNIDEFHQKYFMKLELFTKDAMRYYDVVCYAEEFFRLQLMAMPHREYENQLTVDLKLKHIELGSYGVRQLNNGMIYVYGTGLAEPRFQQALEYRNKIKGMVYQAGYHPSATPRMIHDAAYAAWQVKKSQPIIAA